MINMISRNARIQEVIGRREKQKLRIQKLSNPGLDNWRPFWKRLMMVFIAHYREKS